MNLVNYTLIDMNQFVIEKESSIQLSQFLQDEIEINKHKDNHFLNVKGLSILFPRLVISDFNKFQMFLLSLIFPGWEVIDKQSERRGHPDYLLKKGNEEIFLEIKNSDGLRDSQMRWFLNNKKKSTNKILWIYPDLDLYSVDVSEDGLKL